MRKFLISGGALALLTTAGCNAPSDAPAQNADASGAATSAAATGAQSADGFDWILRINSEEAVHTASISYEDDTTTDVPPLYFGCKAGENRIHAGSGSGPGTLSSMTLTSGDQSVTLNGSSQTNEHLHTTAFTAEPMPGDSPVMQALARDGAIKMTTNGTARDIAASPPARALITRFLNFCKGSGA